MTVLFKHFYEDYILGSPGCHSEFTLLKLRLRPNRSDRQRNKLSWVKWHITTFFVTTFFVVTSYSIIFMPFCMKILFVGALLARRWPCRSKDWPLGV